MNVLVVIPLTSYEYNLRHRKKVQKGIKRAFIELRKSSSIHGIYTTYSPSSNLKNTWESLVSSLNRGLDYAKQGSFKYVWIVESDIVVPKNAFIHLFYENADIAFGCAEPSYDHENLGQTLVYKDLLMAGKFVDPNNSKHPFESVTFHKQDLKGKSFSENVFAGLCCVLLNRKVIDSDLRFQWKDKPDACGHDVYFYYQAQMNYKFKCVLNGNVICEHLR